MAQYYITTPIYYVNDRPHIGHCYTTTVADVAARFHRMFGRDVFFLTGTDEHADKVVSTASERGLSPLQWADQNAAEFVKAFAALNISNDDFIRTSQDRHKDKVAMYIRRLQANDDIYLGEYAGWWDPSQEEYLTETVAKGAGFKSPVTGRELVRRSEKCYFFRLSKYQDRLAKHIEANPDFILPEARRNEVLGRFRGEGLKDIPVSRPVTDDAATQWGIRMPDDPSHRIYVWIDALFNYLSALDTPDRRDFWPPSVHLLAKDILWFHAVIWPCMLFAMNEVLPRTVYAHSYFVRDGRKMSKSLGNFIDLEVIAAYCEKYGRDAFRWFLATQGPLHNTDSDFSHTKFVEVYNADLANGLGNATSRVGNMIDKYFGGKVPDPKGVSQLNGADGKPLAEFDWPTIIHKHVSASIAKADAFDIAGALGEGVALVKKVDAYINATEPFKLAKKLSPAEGTDGGFADSPDRDRLAAILYHCAEALRVAIMIHSPAVPDAAERMYAGWSCHPPIGKGHSFAHVAEWNLDHTGTHHSLKPGQALTKGAILFMRADPADAAPGAVAG